MAIDTVTTNADSGAGSLRDVLAAATAGDTIVFSPTVFTNATTDDIKLASTLVITKNVTIEGHIGGGNGSPNIELDGQNAVTVLSVAAGVTASLDGLLIENGNGVGAAGSAGTISVQHPATLATAGGEGVGGIMNSGNLTITNSQLINNTATGGVGGAGSNATLSGGYQGAGTNGAGGAAGGSAVGAIFDAPGASLTIGTGNVTFAGNSATGGMGGAGGTSFYHGSSFTTNGGTGGASNTAGGNSLRNRYSTTNGNSYYHLEGKGGAAGSSGVAGTNMGGSYRGGGGGGGGGIPSTANIAGVAATYAPIACFTPGLTWSAPRTWRRRCKPARSSSTAALPRPT